jgi:hypothetical protein
MATYDQIMEAARQADAQGNADDARRLLSIAQNMRASGSESTPAASSMMAQAMSGVNEGIASTIGAPVDLMTGAINLGVRGVNSLAGTDIPTINSPVGGSQQVTAAMAPSISREAPQGMGQRFARRVGQELGASALPAGAIAGAASRGTSALSRGVNQMGEAARGNLGLFAAGEAGGAVGAGVGAATAQEVAPDSPFAEITGQLLGGVAGARTASPSIQPDIPSLDDLRSQQEAAYGRVEAAQARINPTSRDMLLSSLQQRAADMNMDEFLHPRAARTLNRLETLPSDPTIHDVEQKRRLVGRDVAGASEAGERALGVGLKAEIDEYLGGLDDTQVSGGDAQEAISALGQGRELTQRIARTEALDEAVLRGERRAATSGTGGNELNAIRQNIRAILDNPRRRRQFSEAQLQAMDEIVRGTPTENAMRLLGRMAPSAGALPMFANLASAGAGVASGSPLGLIPAAVGEASKSAAERINASNIDDLRAAILSGSDRAPRAQRPVDAALISALLARAVASEESNYQP